MRAALALSAILATPAGAQSLEVTDAVLTCLLGIDRADEVRSALTEAGWTLQVDGELGIMHFTHPLGEPDLSLWANQGRCTVSAAIPTDDMSRAVASALRLAKIAPLPARDERGCGAYYLAENGFARIEPGPQDSGCDSKTQSVMILEKAPK